MTISSFLRQVCLVLFVLSAHSYADDLLEVPKVLPDAQQASLKKERASLLAEQRSLNAKIKHSNDKCVVNKKKDDPTLTHKCSVSRQELLSAKDSFNAKAADFNKRIKGLLDTPVGETAAPTN